METTTKTLFALNLMTKCSEETRAILQRLVNASKISTEDFNRGIFMTTVPLDVFVANAPPLFLVWDLIEKELFVSFCYTQTPSREEEDSYKKLLLKNISTLFQSRFEIPFDESTIVQLSKIK